MYALQKQMLPNIFSSILFMASATPGYFSAYVYNIQRSEGSGKKNF